MIVIIQKCESQGKPQRNTDTAPWDREFLVLTPTFDVCGLLVGNRYYLSLREVHEIGQIMVSVK